jgi:glycolate oxidase FAD binding subunit
VNEPLLERLASILPPDGIDRWTRESDGALFPLAAPSRREEWIEVMRLAAAEKLVVLPIGRGSKLGWCRPPARDRLDLVLSTRRHIGIVAHEPGDGTVTARAGTTMSELAAVVGERGHHLSPDVPRPQSATLGGVIAAGMSGVDRLRFGPVRDQLLGTTVLLGDGTVTRSGGRLVKNVTGYALHRLWCGSHGSLCVILEASLRLWPHPEERAAGVVRLENRGEALDLARRLRSLPVRFTTICIHDLDPSLPGHPWTLLLVLGGRREVLEGEIDAIVTVTPSTPSARIASGSDVGAILSSVRDLELSTGRWPTFAFTCRPDDIEETLAHLEASAGESGLAPRSLTHPALGRTMVWLDRVEGGRETPDAAQLVAFHDRMVRRPLRSRWLDPPTPLPDRIEPLGTPPAGLPLMRSLREAIDPDRRFVRGRLHAGL